nr:hypothetical protein [Tanacetum cinerariifolium]GFB30970.1 hypothetical protein [Tanacetum cinerariifolium]
RSKRLRVRNMTDEERKEWERKILKPNGAPKQKWKYMQRYYHKGAFFQDESADNTAGTTGGDGILQLDYSAPTGEDKMDRTRLPKVMQVKHFGRSGRTNGLISLMKILLTGITHTHSILSSNVNIQSYVA